MRFATLTFVFLLRATGAVAEGSGEPTPAIAPELAAAVVRAESIGAALHAHDRAAWVATDALFAELGGDVDGSIVSGWIEEPREDGAIDVLFYLRGENGPRPVFSIPTQDGVAGDVRRLPEGTAFTDAQRVLVNARELAVAQPVQTCSRAYNTVTLPRSDEGVPVYLLAATTNANEMHFGGHYRILVSADGGAVIGFDKFTNSCLLMQLRSEGATHNPISLLVSQIVTPHPTEIHVFNSMSLDVPLFVFTTENEYLWKVENGSAEFVRRMGDVTAASFDSQTAPDCSVLLGKGEGGCDSLEAPGLGPYLKEQPRIHIAPR